MYAANVVTGGARTTCFEFNIGGLGKEFLKAFAISGAKSLAVLDRDLPVAKQACTEIRQAVQSELEVHEDEVSEVNAWQCDVTDPDEVRRTIDDIGKKFGGEIDIFVGAAGRSC
jgi:NAD(P)-dependent dehydrogenase (short-subunit alcohol dehydrogenase family)